MYGELTTLDLIVVAFEKVNAGDENAPLIHELASRLSRAQVYREKLASAVASCLLDEDGSDPIPDHTRITNMLERVQKERHALHAALERAYEMMLRQEDALRSLGADEPDAEPAILTARALLRKD